MEWNRGEADMKKLIMDKNGCTLAEVMAAFVILMIAVEILMQGISFTMRTRKQAEEIRNAGHAVEEKLDDGTECEYGTISLDFGDDMGVIRMDGKLYRKEVDKNFSAAFIWTDEIIEQERFCPNEEDESEETE